LAKKKDVGVNWSLLGVGIFFFVAGVLVMSADFFVGPKAVVMSHKTENLGSAASATGVLAIAASLFSRRLGTFMKKLMGQG
jgi:hypothetical protein